MTKYSHNHYVPVWYQRRFMLPGQNRYFRLDLKPQGIEGSPSRKRHDVHEWSPKRIFAEDDLYTTKWSVISNTEIERFFFGRLDTDGPAAVDYFCNFQHPGADGKKFQALHESSKTAYAERLGVFASIRKYRKPQPYAHIIATRAEHVPCCVDRMRVAASRREPVTDQVHYFRSPSDGLQ